MIRSDNVPQKLQGFCLVTVYNILGFDLGTCKCCEPLDESEYTEKIFKKKKETTVPSRKLGLCSLKTASAVFTLRILLSLETGGYFNVLTASKSLVPVSTSAAREIRIPSRRSTLRLKKKQEYKYVPRLLEGEFVS